MTKIIVAAIICILLSVKSSNNPCPETIRIGLFSEYQIKGFSFSALEGNYYIIDNKGNTLRKMKPYDHLTVELKNNKIRLSFKKDTLFVNNNITFAGQSFKNTFLINPSNKNIYYRIYDDDLIINNNFTSLTIINHVPFENYIAGVVESESGFGKHPEYYNLQATISRTYAVKNLYRHIHEGFNLCDEVHCQAYYGKSIYPDIVFATDYTRSDIITDYHGQPINAVFHANCGGMTLNSENVWSNESPHLKAVADTFCSKKPGALWEKTIPKKLLYQYLQNNLGNKLNDSIAENIYNFTQKQRKYYLDPYKTIHLARFRNDFELRSTFFDIIPTDDNLLITGKGYGHGVGLCQEGAMRMAEKGLSRDSIIRFYYKNAFLKIYE